MEYRLLGKSGFTVSAISLGTWQFGGSWGNFDTEMAMQVLHQAVDSGVNFFDTADVYGDGHAESLLGRLVKEREERLILATKIGLRLDEQSAESYTKIKLQEFLDRSLKKLGVDRIDLLQLHSPPTDVYYRPEVFFWLSELVSSGKVGALGVSVNRVEEGLKAIEYPEISSVQIVFNIFRQRASELFLSQAKRKKVGVVARLPLSSGLLGGKLSTNTLFPMNDHRNYNRSGTHFDKGETFSGIDFESALEAVELLKELVPVDATMAQWALKWVLMHDEISCVIPGARRPSQVIENTAACRLSQISPQHMAIVEDIYRYSVKAQAHHHW